MDEREIRTRCIEAAARAPIVHQNGSVAGVLEAARQWEAWIVGRAPAPEGGKATLHLPKKG